jgi:hypothetical protein
MKTTHWLLSLFTCGTLLFVNARAATLHVWQESPLPTPPYETWLTAATNIQDAVDEAAPGDMVLVVGGVYDSGGRPAGTSFLTNRVTIDKPITVQSLMGPEVTVIRGWQVQMPSVTNGDEAVRCVYLANGATLSGFTLTNGATRGLGGEMPDRCGGGLYCESFGGRATNCILTGNAASYEGGGASAGVLDHCTLRENRAHTGGGASGSLMDNCTLAENSAHEGGGMYGATLRNCTLTGNSAFYGGAGSEGTMANCLLTGNSASKGGGVTWCELQNCVLTSNSAAHGGGAAWSTLNNCLLSGNSASSEGGGAQGSTLNNCTLTGNAAAGSGGGVCDGVLRNCIIYLNSATNGANYAASTEWPVSLDHCCTTPMPTDGVGNITNDPAFLNGPGGDVHLQTNSPCINSGNNSYVTTITDLDGNPRTTSGTVDIGAYEYQGTGSAISYACLQQYGLPTDGSADSTDPDGDGHNTWQEWQADTNPTNAACCLRLCLSNSPSMTVSFTSSAARLYRLLCCTNLNCSSSGSFWTPVPGQTDIPGTGDVLTLIHTNPPAPAFYRVSARFP